MSMAHEHLPAAHGPHQQSHVMFGASDLRSSFCGEVLLPGNPRYDTARRVWDPAIDRRPKLIARCTCTEDVVAAVGFARDMGLTVSVRGGGHSVAGYGVWDDALMLDLSPMKAIQINTGY